MAQYYNTITGMLEETENTIIRYACDYCGGFEVEKKDQFIPQTVSAMNFVTEAIAHQPAIDIKVCIWCFKKALDVSLEKK